MKPLFSNLVTANGQLVHQPGSILGSAALIAGTTIGAGILALPAATLPAGVLPSTAVMVAVWLYMVASGLLIAEANVQAMRVSGQADIGLLATIRQNLGNGGAIAAGSVYIFIHYALLVAYIARGGDILAMAATRLCSHLNPSFTVPLWYGHVLFALLFGVLLYWGSAQFVGRLNTALVAIVIVTFGSLLALILGQVDLSRWQVQHWEAIGTVVPTMFVAFVYQNVVPVVTAQLEGDGRRVRWAIWWGSLVPLVMFVSWNALMIGSIDVDVVQGDQLDPVEILRQGRSHPLLGTVVSVFSEFAIATSFIGFVFGLLSVLQDIFSPSFREKNGLLPLYLLIFLPPLLLSVADPNIFFNAIDLAGAFGNSTLFGIIPAVMAWQYRYRPNLPPDKALNETIEPMTQKPNQLVPGGKGLLMAMIAIAMGVIVQNALRYFAIAY